MLGQMLKMKETQGTGADTSAFLRWAKTERLASSNECEQMVCDCIRYIVVMLDRKGKKGEHHAKIKSLLNLHGVLSSEPVKLTYDKNKGFLGDGKKTTVDVGNLSVNENMFDALHEVLVLGSAVSKTGGKWESFKDAPLIIAQDEARESLMLKNNKSEAMYFGWYVRVAWDKKKILHAEQSLMYLLNSWEFSRDGLTVPVTICGNKVPCKDCKVVLAAFKVYYEERAGAKFNTDVDAVGESFSNPTLNENLQSRFLFTRSVSGGSKRRLSLPVRT